MENEKTNKWANHNITAEGDYAHESRIDYCIWKLKQVNDLLIV